MKHWKQVFENLFSCSQEINARFETDNGAVWEIILTRGDHQVMDDRVQIYETSVMYAEIVELQIPEVYEARNYWSENDLSRLFDSIRFVKDMTVKTLVNESGPMKGSYLSITSKA